MPETRAYQKARNGGKMQLVQMSSPQLQPIIDYAALETDTPPVLARMPFEPESGMEAIDRAVVAVLARRGTQNRPEPSL